MAELVTWNPKLEVAARKMVDLANERGGHDNCSVQLVRVLQVTDNIETSLY